MTAQLITLLATGSSTRALGAAITTTAARSTRSHR